MNSYTVQCGYADYYAATVTVESDDPEGACRFAVEMAADDDRWKAVCHVGDTFVDAIGEGDEAWAEKGL